MSAGSGKDPRNAPEPQASACAAHRTSSVVVPAIETMPHLETTGSTHSTTPVVLSVIAPCYNESGNIAALCDRVLKVFDRLDVIGELVLVDDGSTDDTWSRIQQRQQGDDRVRGHRHERNRGIVPAWRTGLESVRGALVCLIDADLQNPPESIEPMLHRYGLGQVDMVQGARCPEGSEWTRLAFSKGLNVLLNILFGMRLRDNKSGFVLTTPAVLHEALAFRGSYGFAQCFITVFAHAHRRTIGEVITPFHRRVSGQSFLTNVPVRVILRIFWELAKARLEFGRIRRACGDRAVRGPNPIAQVS